VRTADTVVLTLGTAWAYRLRETGELVSNLHKLPANLFEKELLTADEIVNSIAEVHALLRRANPAIRIVLTVSPVRHIKDTLPLNAVSKSVLRVACHYLSELLPNVSYFPAYELLTDDLRDYRFYAADMLHPSEVAEDYIWERFARTYFDADFGRFRKEWAAVRQSLGHRPLHIGAPEHRTFLDQTRERLERLTAQGVDVRQELRDVQRQLAALPPPRPVRLPEPEPLDDEERIDIGDDAAVVPAISALTNERPVDLTTRDERRRDNRRDGRRNDRSNRDRRDTQPQSVVDVPFSEEIISEEITPEEQLLAAVEGRPAAEATIPEEGAGYPAKKKKRRSRGGAKRTARKNAARLAEQEGDEATTTIAEGASELEGVDDSTNELELTTPIPITEPVEPTPVFEFTSDEPTPEAVVETAATVETPATAAQPTPTRKRGTGPTPKKSKVITKSGLLKRGQRNPLYRPAPSEPAPIVDTVPAEAPIISPPIIPEILLERPAAALEVFIQPELPAPSEPATEETPTTATKTKRGRPKAKPVPDETPATTAATAPETAAPSAPENVPEEPKPKRAARSSKTAKPKAAAKKEPAKPATTRRGRPPGKKTPPPAADTPAT
jgi:hypothetical protein